MYIYLNPNKAFVVVIHPCFKQSWSLLAQETWNPNIWDNWCLGYCRNRAPTRAVFFLFKQIRNDNTVNIGSGAYTSRTILLPKLSMVVSIELPDVCYHGVGDEDDLGISLACFAKDVFKSLTESKLWVELAACIWCASTYGLPIYDSRLFRLGVTLFVIKVFSYRTHRKVMTYMCRSCFLFALRSYYIRSTSWEHPRHPYLNWNLI